MYIHTCMYMYCVCDRNEEFVFKSISLSSIAIYMYMYAMYIGSGLKGIIIVWFMQMLKLIGIGAILT